MSKRPNLSALADAAGSVRRPMEAAPAPANAPEAPQPVRSAAASPSRVGLKPITAHYPVEVRMQLKILAAEKGRSMESMLGEALNDLFAKYGKPELVPVGDRQAA